MDTVVDPLPPLSEDFGPDVYEDLEEKKRRNGKVRVDPFAERDKRNRLVQQATPGFEYEIGTNCIAEIADKDPSIFQRAGMLVRVARAAAGSIMRTPTAPSIEVLPKPMLRARLDVLVSVLDHKGEEVSMPGWLVDLVDAFGEWTGIRRLEGVVQSPILRADGTILDAAGYDPATGLLYEPNDTFPQVRPCPTREDAEQALREILEVIAEFPFEQDKHRSAYLTMLFTPFARYAFHGPVPLGVIDGTVPGVGKGLLAQIIGVLVDGCEIPPTPQPEYDDEERKLITSIAMSGARLVLIDNVTRPVGSGALEALLTTTRWRDRVLGVSKTWEGDVAACWMCTGNNVQFRKKDTIRRVVHVRLRSRVETPEARANFRHPDLLAWVRKERGRLVAAILTILRAHALAGGPADMTPWGSFTGWSNVVRSAVVWLGQRDPADTRTELAEVADTETLALKTLLERWAKHQTRDGLKCKDALDMARTDRDMLDAINELCAPKGGHEVTPRALGNRLRDLKGRVVGVELHALGQPVLMCLETIVDRKGIAMWKAVSEGESINDAERDTKERANADEDYWRDVPDPDYEGD